MTTRRQPRIVERTAQPYVSMRRLVTMDAMAEVADRIPELFGWLGARGIEPAGAPFLKYDVVDMEGELDVEAGVPVGEGVPGEGDVLAGVLPAGRYATVTHVGHPDGLIQATADLLGWAKERDLVWDMTPTDRGERWGCRLEIYNTNPIEVPDLSKWETDLAFRLAD